MPRQQDPTPFRSTSYRVITACFGILFVAISIAIVMSAAWPMTIGVIVAAVVIGGLGLDAVLSALRGTSSLLTRIGPLP